MSGDGILLAMPPSQFQLIPIALFKSAFPSSTLLTSLVPLGQARELGEVDDIVLGAVVRRPRDDEVGPGGR